MRGLLVVHLYLTKLGGLAHGDGIVAAGGEVAGDCLAFRPASAVDVSLAGTDIATDAHSSEKGLSPISETVGSNWTYPLRRRSR